MKQNNKTNILFRYYIITAIFFLVGLVIVAKLIQNVLIEGPAWNERAKRELAKIDTIAPERGNILASNGNILACNLQVYDIKIDLRHQKIKELSPIPFKAVDSLADSLDQYYPRRKDFASLPKDSQQMYSWRTKLYRELEKPFEKRPRALTLARKKTRDDIDRIRSFPLLNRFKGKGFRNPTYAEEREIRMYPFGRMAHRSIGRVNEDKVTGEIHGYSGLEKDLDSLLYGHPGLAKKVALTRGLSNWFSREPVRGYDLITTIDIDLQDMLEEELHDICLESNAEWGTAILMEVATGEIKAISNIERLDDGSYGEALNRAVLPYEPGSVMKPISLMIAFEDGLVKSVNERVDCSPFQRTSDPHAPSVKTIKQVIEMSSNTGIARIIFRKYASDPSKFHDRLASIGFFEPMQTGIAGEIIPRIKKLLPTDSRGNNITMTARHLDLARQAYGYNTEIPPIYTLSIYNAIANKGKYVRPHLLRGMHDAMTGHDSILPIQYIRPSICSPETAAKVAECMREVVWGEHGTARLVRDDRVEIVGKTGTAYPVEKGAYNTSKRRYAFAGFFPYANPKYSCMALVLGPSGNSANRTSGQVVKNMALKMYSRGMLDKKSTFEKSPDGAKPTLASSTTKSPSKASRMLDTPLSVIRTTPDVEHNTVPSVTGYDAVSAIRILEKKGLNVVLRGTGRVVGQSIDPGTRIRKGEKILLTLKT